MIFGSAGLLVVMMFMVIGDSDTGNGVCDKYGDDDVTWWCWMVVLARGVEEQRDEGVVMRGHTLPKNKTSIRDQWDMYACI